MSKSQTRSIIAYYLTAIVKEKNLSLYQLEKLTGLPGHQIKPVLAGEKSYNVDTLDKVLNALEIEIGLNNKAGQK